MVYFSTLWYTIVHNVVLEPRAAASTSSVIAFAAAASSPPRLATSKKREQVKGLGCGF